ncbi:DUF4191 domain-containing protein [Austwickia chelonae]|uniref:DUF4191 domain-containing protein n=1 Tax=Austwickia chelonae TaxID=100225 RepID=UPI000E2534BA|nr:DUF4191 domain-containing protein [Austwickia chelonae]
MARAAKDPNSPGFIAKMKTRFSQFKQVFSLAKSAEPRLPLYLAAIILGSIAVGYAVGLAIGQPIYVAFLVLMLGLLACVWMVAKKAEKGVYKQIAGQPGEVGAALSGIRRGWSYQQEPVAADAGGSRDPRHAALIYRAIGRPGVVLIAEGPAGRASKLLVSEQKRTARLAPNVPIHVFRVGAGKGPEVTSSQNLLKKMNSLKKVLTKHEVPAIDKRLRSMGGMRPPVPQGIDPQRMRGMKGQRR